MIVACIPAYNEESTIPKVILQTKKYVDEVIVCDDGSKDMTAELAEQLGARVIKHNNNRGKGAALRSLFLAAQAFNPTVVVTIDADGQHNPQDIPKLVKPIIDGQADIVIGSRYLSDSKVPSYRKLGGKVLDKLTSLGRKLDISDTQSGFRAFSINAIKQIDITTSGFEVESELLLKAAEKGLRMMEVPVTISYEGKTSTKHPITHASEVAGYLIRKLLIAHPLVFLGIPGFGILGFAVHLSLRILENFYKTGYFSIPQSLIAFTLFIVGVILLLFSLTLLAINVAVKEGKER